MIKTLNKISLEGTYLNIVKSIDEKLTANIILNGEKLKAFLIQLGTRQEIHSHHHFNIIPEVIFKIIYLFQRERGREHKHE